MDLLVLKLDTPDYPPWYMYVSVVVDLLDPHTSIQVVLLKALPC
jgi:hypothetical protein